MAVDTAGYSLPDDLSPDYWQRSRTATDPTSGYSLFGGADGGIDPSKYDLYSGLDATNALDTPLGPDDSRNTWLRRLARSVAEKEVNPDPKQGQPSSQQPEGASRSEATPAPSMSHEFATQNPAAVGKGERAARQSEATSSLARSVGKIVRLIAAGYAGAAGGGAAGGAAGGAGGADAAGGAAAGGGGGAALGGGGGTAGIFGSFGGGGGGSVGEGATFGQNFQGAYLGQSGTSGWGGALGGVAKQLGSGGGGGGGGGGGDAGGASADVAQGGGGGKGPQSITNFIQANRLRKSLGLLAEAEGGGLSSDAGGGYFAS